MKYLISIALLLALHGCERNSTGSPDSAEGAASPESVAAEKAPDNLDEPPQGARGPRRRVPAGPQRRGDR